jgi:hypothetical protein
MANCRAFEPSSAGLGALSVCRSLRDVFGCFGRRSGLPAFSRVACERPQGACHRSIPSRSSRSCWRPSARFDGPPRVVVKRHRSGHHASDDRRGTKMHQHIAPRVDDDGLVQLQPVRGRNRAGRRQSTLFGSADHLEQSGTSEGRCGRAPRHPVSRRRGHVCDRIRWLATSIPGWWPPDVAAAISCLVQRPRSKPHPTRRFLRVESRLHVRR